MGSIYKTEAAKNPAPRNAINAQAFVNESIAFLLMISVAEKPSDLKAWTPLTSIISGFLSAFFIDQKTNGRGRMTQTGVSSSRTSTSPRPASSGSFGFKIFRKRPTRRRLNDPPSKPPANTSKYSKYSLSLIPRFNG